WLDLLATAGTWQEHAEQSSLVHSVQDRRRDLAVRFDLVSRALDQRRKRARPLYQLRPSIRRYTIQHGCDCVPVRASRRPGPAVTIADPAGACLRPAFRRTL